jgi:hypothetical protein
MGGTALLAALALTGAPPPLLDLEILRAQDLLPPGPPRVLPPPRELEEPPDPLDPQPCLVVIERCSTRPCVQFVRKRDGRARCERYPSRRPRIIPTR